MNIYTMQANLSTLYILIVLLFSGLFLQALAILETDPAAAVTLEAALEETASVSEAIPLMPFRIIPFFVSPLLVAANAFLHTFKPTMVTPYNVALMIVFALPHGLAVFEYIQGSPIATYFTLVNVALPIGVAATLFRGISVSFNIELAYFVMKSILPPTKDLVSIIGEATTLTALVSAVNTVTFTNNLLPAAKSFLVELASNPIQSEFHPSVTDKAVIKKVVDFIQAEIELLEKIRDADDADPQSKVYKDAVKVLSDLTATITITEKQCGISENEDPALKFSLKKKPPVKTVFDEISAYMNGAKKLTDGFKLFKKAFEGIPKDTAKQPEYYGNLKPLKLHLSAEILKISKFPSDQPAQDSVNYNAAKELKDALLLFEKIQLPKEKDFDSKSTSNDEIFHDAASIAVDQMKAIGTRLFEAIIEADTPKKRYDNPALTEEPKKNLDGVVELCKSLVVGYPNGMPCMQDMTFQADSHCEKVVSAIALYIDHIEKHLLDMANGTLTFDEQELIKIRSISKWRMPEFVRDDDCPVKGALDHFRYIKDREQCLKENLDESIDKLSKTKNNSLSDRVTNIFSYIGLYKKTIATPQEGHKKLMTAIENEYSALVQLLNETSGSTPQYNREKDTKILEPISKVIISINGNKFDKFRESIVGIPNSTKLLFEDQLVGLERIEQLFKAAIDVMNWIEEVKKAITEKNAKVLSTFISKVKKRISQNLQDENDVYTVKLCQNELPAAIAALKSAANESVAKLKLDNFTTNEQKEELTSLIDSFYNVREIIPKTDLGLEGGDSTPLFDESQGPLKSLITLEQEIIVKLFVDSRVQLSAKLPGGLVDTVNIVGQILSEVPGRSNLVELAKKDDRLNGVITAMNDAISTYNGSCASATIVPEGADYDEIKQNANNILGELIQIKAHEIKYSNFTGEDDLIFCGGMGTLNSFLGSH